MTDAGLIASRRRLLLRDGLTFFVLTLTTVVLFVLTWLLFRSFTEHRAELAVRWAGRGEAALRRGRPEEAVAALRTALVYAPDERADQMMLAQALAESGHAEEAMNYFLNLWEAQPGDGVINLQLARLARRRGTSQEAVRYYRAAIFGNWEGDGVERRREARLELADYLIDLGDLAAAQSDLLIAASNAPANAGLELRFGDALERAGDLEDALRYYQKAISREPRNAVAFEKAGRLAFRMGNYAQARGWLERALRESAGAPGTAGEADGLEPLLKRTERLLVLSPAAATSSKDRITRLLDDKAIARGRWSACVAQLGKLNAMPVVQALNMQWAGAAGISTREALAADQAHEDAVMELIDQSETMASDLCGAPSGDDALLLLLAGRR
ncbi:MAG TPA: tetratricopeptide repeat protein [Granulicella sp.]|nr:tetratricopeptide repeat protein [Granulicella sp.]